LQTVHSKQQILDSWKNQCLPVILKKIGEWKVKMGTQSFPDASDMSLPVSFGEIA
jgi:hypothetical protein